jgi:hypothetical protein
VAFHTVPGVLAITPALLTITADDQTIPEGAMLPDLTVTYAGLVNGDTPSTFATAPNVAPVVTTDATSDSPAETIADIDVGGAYDPNYNITYAPGTLTVTPDVDLGTTTTLETPVPSTYGQAVTFKATVTSVVGTPTGDVEFDEGSTILGVAPLTGGTVSLTMSTLPAGSHAITARYLGSSPEYSPSTSATASQEVQKATPTVTWTTPSAIVYGTPLSSTQLDASADVPGTFTYTPAAETTLDAGNDQALAAVFTPDDSADYNTVTTGTTLTITQAPLTITADDATKTSGTTRTFSSTAFTVSGLVNGDTVTGVTETSAGAPASATPGSYAIVPSAATGSGLNNYSIDYVNGTLTVNAVTPTPTPTPSPTPTPTPSPTPTVNATAAPPVLLGARSHTVTLEKKKITDLILTFSEPLRTPGGVYQVTQAGKTKKAPPKHVAITSETLGPGATSVVLTLGKHTTDKPLRLIASGLTGADGQPVKPFVTRLSRHHFQKTFSQAQGSLRGGD